MNIFTPLRFNLMNFCVLRVLEFHAHVLAILHSARLNSFTELQGSMHFFPCTGRIAFHSVNALIGARIVCSSYSAAV
jgi:hypothetical protein